MADDHDDPLENELAETFRPAPMSLELRERIGAELSRRPLKRFIAPIAAIAACVVIGLLVWRARDASVEPVGQLPTVQAPIDSAPPTVIEYQRAFAKSSESLEALLARPAGGDTRISDSPAEPVRAFSRSFNGESL